MEGASSVGTRLIFIVIASGSHAVLPLHCERKLEPGIVEPLALGSFWFSWRDKLDMGKWLDDDGETRTVF